MTALTSVNHCARISLIPLPEPVSAHIFAGFQPPIRLGEMPIARIRHIAYIFLAFLLVLWAVFPLEALAAGPPAQDVVILVDCSDSMSAYLPSIVGVLQRYAADARQGDSLTCYQFSSKPILVAGGEVNNVEDKKRIRSQLQNIRPVGAYTNYYSAIEKGLTNIENSFSRRPSSDRVLILITDGRRHPNDTSSEQTTLKNLRKRFSRLKVGEDYMFYCFYVGEWLESDLQSFLLGMGADITNWRREKEWLDKLSLVDIRIMDQTAFLGHIPETPSQGSFSIAFYPRRVSDRLAMLELDIEKDFGKVTLDKFFDVNPRRFVCRQQPWNEKFMLETRGFDIGDYAGRFTFKPSEPRELLLYPRVVDFRFSISGTLSLHSAGPLVFGPTGFKGPFSETLPISVFPTKTAFPSNTNAITVRPDIELPEGFKLDISKVMREREILISVSITRDGTTSSEAEGRYDGIIRFHSETGWALTNTEIPITIDVSRAKSNVGPIILYVILGLGLTAIIGLGALAFKNVRTVVQKRLSHATYPGGKLIIVNDPTKGIVRNINIDLLCEKEELTEIIIGVGREVDVDLPHHSMRDRVYRISGIQAKERVHTMIEAQHGTDHVIINDASSSGKIQMSEASRGGRSQLRHLDSVRFGAFEFRYEIPNPLRQVILYYLDGKVMKGWPLSWNTRSDGFRFLDRDNLPNRKEVFVRFYELKAVTFVRDFEGEVTQRLRTIDVPHYGHHVRLFFDDDEEMTGHMIDWKNPGEKFYFFPDSLGENAMFLLIEKSTIRDIALLKEDNRGANKAREHFTQILEMMKKEFGG